MRKFTSFRLSHTTYAQDTTESLCHNVGAYILIRLELVDKITYIILQV